MISIQNYKLLNARPRLKLSGIKMYSIKLDNSRVIRPILYRKG